jgi:hypothetical protein
MFALCPCFSSEGAKPRNYSEDGTKKHEQFSEAMKALLSGKEFNTEDEGLTFAIHSVFQKFNDLYPDKNIIESEYYIEEKVIIEDEHLNEISTGTSDLIIDDILIDEKNGQARNYRPQMEMYARGYMQSKLIDKMHVMEIYTKDKATKEYILTLDECIKNTNRIIAMVYNPYKKPNPNEHCNWCGKAAECEPLTNVALDMLVCMDVSFKDKIDNFKLEEITNPDKLGFLLDMWKILIKPYGEALEYRAKSLVEQGIIPTGYKVQKRADSPTVNDLQELFKASNLDASSFLSCCKISTGSLQEAMKIKDKKEFNQFLEPYVTRGEDTKALIRVKK